MAQDDLAWQQLSASNDGRSAQPGSTSWSTTPPIFEAATWDGLDFELWQRVMAINLNGTMLMCKAFLPLMRGHGWGRVINVASATVKIASPGSIAYRTSKMGVIGFTRALSATFGGEGITMNAVLLSRQSSCVL